MRRRRSDTFVSRLRKIFIVGVTGLIVLPVLADGASGFMRSASSVDGCRIIQVIDGDTVTLWCKANGTDRARVIGYDTPELFSPSCSVEFFRAFQAKWQLRWLIWTAKDIDVSLQNTDRYGRALINLTINGKDVATQMIEKGHARPYQGGRRQSWCEMI